MCVAIANGCGRCGIGMDRVAYSILGSTSEESIHLVGSGMTKFGFIYF